MVNGGGSFDIMATRNSVYVIQGEMSMVVSCMRRNARWAASEREEQDPLLQSFSTLRQNLATIEDLDDVDVDVFLGPFLAVVRSEATTGPITAVALSSINKFLSYGLIDMESPSAAAGIENIADAVTHAKFVGTDIASDEVVLMKILQVLRTILLTPVGTCMSNESVCELMQTCFRLCFEMRLSELLRKSAEQTLTDMVHLLFSRLSSLTEEDVASTKGSPVKALQRLPSAIDSSASVVPVMGSLDTETRPGDAIAADGASGAPLAVGTMSVDSGGEGSVVDAGGNGGGSVVDQQTRYNKRGVRFTTRQALDGELVAYGVPCILELFRFLISLINPRDRHNNETMMAMGLALLTVALETGGMDIARFSGLLQHVEDGMCKNLLALLKCDNLNLHAATLRVIFLTFEAQRCRLKFQLAAFLTQVMEMEYHTYEHKEGVLDTMLQLCRIPGFLTDLYTNFDCSLYCENMFDKTIQFLAQNAYPEERLLATHLNALDALLTILKEIGANAASALKPTADGPSNTSSEAGAGSKQGSSGLVASVPGGDSSNVVTGDDVLPLSALRRVRKQKVQLDEGVQLFNEKPKKGIAYLQEQGFLETPVDSTALVRFLRSEPRLDKTALGEYIGDRKNPEVMEAFILSFDVSELALDEALRKFLTTFRLPGESAVIERIFEKFAQHWYGTYKHDKVPASADDTFVLTYAIIQLNVDQHNSRVKNPMTFEQFSRNQRGLNSGKDFPTEYLEEMYNNIRDNEIVLPAEREGDVKADYDWQMMLNRARNSEQCRFVSMRTHLYDEDLFAVVWGPAITALCYVLDTALDDTLVRKVLDHMRLCATVCARYQLSDVFDNLVVALCKRILVVVADADAGSELHGSHDAAEPSFVDYLGKNTKIQAIAHCIFSLTHEHGSILRHGWQDVLDIIAQFFTAQLLPPQMMSVFHFITGTASLQQAPEAVDVERESSFLTSFFGFGSPAPARVRSAVADDITNAAKASVDACRIPQLLSESAFLQDESLLELCKSLVVLSRGPAAGDKDEPAGGSEQMAVFFLELLADVTMANKDRMHVLWDLVVEHVRAVVLQGDGRHPRLAEHALVTLVRIGDRLHMREGMAPRVLQALALLDELPPAVLVSARAHVVAGLASLIKTNSSGIDADGWALILGFLIQCSNDLVAVDHALDAIFFVVDNALTQDNVALCQDAAVNFVDLALDSTLSIDAYSAPAETGDGGDDDSASKQPLAARLLNLLHAIHLAAPKVVATYHPWSAHWEPLLQAMSRFCTVVQRSVRHHAVALLHSSLMLPEMDERLSEHEWKACLENVLFPLMEALLNPPTQSAPVASLEEIRMRTSALMSKVFLQHLSVLQRLGDFISLWMRLLDLLEKYLRAGSELAEAVPESLKNMLLVMSTHGILRPPDVRGVRAPGAPPSLWQITFSRIESLVPGMFQELFPDIVAPAPVLATHAHVAAAAPAITLVDTPVRARTYIDHAASTPASNGAGAGVARAFTHPASSMVMATPVGVAAPGTPPPMSSPTPPQFPEVLHVHANEESGPAAAPHTPQGQAPGSPKLQLHSTPITI
eukprot:m.1438472 g.1438472  ORF g.1438472 m.1438472 type:complete len:1564 (+) comp25091_c1_seq3:265-4956(+)